MVQAEEVQRVLHFHHIPSLEDFSTDIEPSNIPAVFHGAIKEWEAVTKWNPSAGGLDYLQERVGSAVVDAMMSKSAPIFYGDLRNYERVSIPFASFMTACRSYHKGIGTFSGHGDDAKLSNLEEMQTSVLDALDLIYLAQVPIVNQENKEPCPLDMLRDDLEMPIFLVSKELASINLWMNRARSRSSTHYDPHHNLLCLVAGCKQVVLWPPCACHVLYPMPIFGEASNHSAVDLVNPDYSLHARAINSDDYSQKVVLHPGDALFIPEGWYHQVDSDDLTIAVNFWWKSRMMCEMLEHMDAYYLRRILSRLVDKEMNFMLRSLEDVSMAKDRPLKENTWLESNDQRLYTAENTSQMESDKLDPQALDVLYRLISLVHSNLSMPSHGEISGLSHTALVSSAESADESNSIGHSSLLENPVASILWNIDPLVLQDVLLYMVNHFPRTLEGLILHMLSPTTAEVLTRKFDEMDGRNTSEKQSEFYHQFYSVFDDQYAAMGAILLAKESFSFQAFCNVLEKHLGVSVDKPRTFRRSEHCRSRPL